MLLDSTGLDDTCFKCGHESDEFPMRASNVVMLQEFRPGDATARLLTAPVIDMKPLLNGSLGRVETRLRMVPDIIAVRWPQYWDSAEEGAEDEDRWGGRVTSMEH